ncbi:S1 family peptidase [Lentzea sp. NPDC006480]|uniref:S1 family peptidase n=1 Tax=Lentzea sp. NPDC006480 TaxID=3157176 RepID=UPI0033B04238
MTVRRSLITGVVAVSVATFALHAESIAAPAGKPGAVAEIQEISPQVRARMAAEVPFADAADRIEKAIAHSGADGLSGVGLENEKLVVWWKGAVPTEVSQEISRASVPVEVRAAAHSRRELEVTAEIVAAQMRADAKSPIHMVLVPIDGSRVIAGADRADVAVRTSGTDVPVEVVVRKRAHTTAGPATRYNDGWAGNNFAPFSGGGAIINADNGARCTAGFGVQNIAGAQFLLTAGHCGRVNGAWFNGNRSRSIGTARHEHVAHDLLLIPTSADNWMWDGGATTGNFTKRVDGWAEARPGFAVCHSGSTSGAVCNFTNSNNFVYSYCDNDAYGNYECYNDMVYADYEPGGTGSRDGDSGGPVFTLVGSNAVRAVGTLDGSGDGFMIYQDFLTATRDFGITTIG